MNLLHQQQEKDLSLLRPFDLEKVKDGEALCDVNDCLQYVLLGVSSAQYNPNIAVQLINNSHDYIYLCTKDNLRMKPLCWLEGRPVYRGDVLWHTTRGFEDYNYVVESFDGKDIYSTPEGRGCIEHIKHLSWVKREKEAKEKLPEVLHDVNKFKVGDKVKVVRVLPRGSYWDKGWGKRMGDYLGEICTVADKSKSANAILLTSPVLGYHWFSPSVLELVEQPKGTQKKVKVLEVYLDGELIKKEEIKVE